MVGIAIGATRTTGATAIASEIASEIEMVTLEDARGMMTGGMTTTRGVGGILTPSDSIVMLVVTS